jgi:hypothetical protein
MQYRAYTVGDDGHLAPPRVFECGSDDEAIAVVRGFLNGKPVELWQGDRMVVWCENIDDQFMALRIDA